MVTAQDVEVFLSQKKLAVVGVSAKGGKFGNMAYKALRQKGYQVFPVHPEAETLEGDKAYPSFADLPEPVGGVLIVVPPYQTEKVVAQAKEAGIQRVWMQQGAESDAAIRYCKDNGISEVHGHCIMMFAQPVGFGHNLHRFVWGLLGKLPR